MRRVRPTTAGWIFLVSLLLVLFTVTWWGWWALPIVGVLLILAGFAANFMRAS
jgi:hypothetical protein